MHAVISIMNRIKILLIFFASCCLVNGQHRPCTPPGGGQGQCKSIYNCEPLLSILNNPTRTSQDISILQRSQCGFNGNTPLVCCPEQTLLTPVTNQCTTPDGKPGRCIGVYSCSNIVNLLKPPLTEAQYQFVAKSECKGPEQYSVCCGLEPDLNRVQKGGCESKVTALPPDPRTECCGIDSSTGNKIVGGTATAVDQYPWMALIEHKSTGIVDTPCGGVLISARYVLTAAHCVSGRSASGRPTHIRLGEYDTKNEGPDCAPVDGGGTDCTKGIISIPIEKIVTHPEYVPKSSSKRHDIALIRMRQAAPYTEFIRPICLPRQDVTLKRSPFNMTVAGWGMDESGQNSPVKLDVQLPFVPLDECAPNTTIGNLWRGQLCAGGLRGQDSCRGDSGGPLMYENFRQYEVIGVVSIGAVPCGTESLPGVYTNVYEYVSWIKSNVAP